MPSTVTLSFIDLGLKLRKPWLEVTWIKSVPPYGVSSNVEFAGVEAIFKTF